MHSSAGSIPSEIGKLSKLVVMESFYNCLEGMDFSIEFNIYWNHTVRYIYSNNWNDCINSNPINMHFMLYYQIITGTLPSELGKLSLLGQLDVSHNSLEGILINCGASIQLSSVSITCCVDTIF